MNSQNPEVLLVGWGFPPKIDGGLDIHVYHLFEELQKNDVNVSLALPESRAPVRDDIIPVETGEGDMMEKSRRMSQEVAKIAENFDIVHTHDWFGAESGYKSKKYSDTVWISTVHSLASDRTRNPDERLEKLEKVATTQPDILISVSKKLRDSIKKKYSAESKVIYNGFSKPKSSGVNVRERHGIKGDMVFYVGRHAEQKGIEHLLYGFKKALEEYSDLNLVLGGKGHMSGSLREFVEILSIDDKVVFTDFIPREELGDYYEAADVFVSPSLNEPFGLTITEALESCTPVVATENGVEEISSDLIISIKPESSSIKDGILKALDKEVLEYEEFRSWSDMAEETLEIYNNVYDNISKSCKSP